MMSLSEADTCRKFVIPKLQAADWDDDLISMNLDLKNPNTKNDTSHIPTEELVISILNKERRILNSRAD